ncbi:hypothetical protein JVT61DRAFT_4818 [Boletus reticuloceps]|uniref:Uncharacterized protein n=1 Tax=Boletus reticuloceps TaxID=495285 RepID=A0A8I3A8S8_9AGAM|nr:hypothetical protein JVT61DRAFT_4818 [Boletus reticuloceps]
MVLSNPYSNPGSPTRLHHSFGSTPTSSTPTIDILLDRPTDTASSLRLPPPPLWPHRLSASFSAMADQIAAASQALALVPATAFSGTDASAELGTFRCRLDGIEQTQERVLAEFESLKVQLTMDRGNSDVDGDANGSGSGDGSGSGEVGDNESALTVVAVQAAKIEELEKKLNELCETVRLDQERLPARLHNSRATVMKASLKTPTAANGKPVAGFPLTRGEFEHITKERYEVLLKAYAQPLRGDTAAKRDALRAFAGIPQDGQ